MPTYRLLPHLRNLAAIGRALAFVVIAVALATTLWLAPVIAQQRTDTTIHTVQAGETLSEIAAQYGVNPDELLAINELDDPNAIFVGQQLTVPVAPVEPAPRGTHRVRLGETLTSIAARYDLAIGQLMRMNGIVNPDEVTAGQLLIVSSAVTPTPTSQSEPTPTSAAAAQATPTVADELPATHTVAAGETLSAIARRYGLTVSQLLVQNELENADELIEGQELIIVPMVSPESSATPIGAADELPPQTPSTTATPTAAAVPASHTVAAGETLSAIARRYGLTVSQLLVQNELENADELIEGQELIIVPAVSPEPSATPTLVAEAPPTQTPSATATPTAIALPSTHTVAPGETLSGIAKSYGLTVAALMSLNDLIDPDAIRVGEVLQLTVPEPTDLTVIESPKPPAETPAEAPVVTPVEESATIAVVEMPATTPLPTPEITRSGNPIASLNRTYAVRPGDSLGLIALRQGVDLDALAHLNGFTDASPALNAGRTLLLPAVGDDLRMVSGAEAYVVKPGESLGQIADAFGLTVGDILAANRLTDLNAIYPGEQLVIPVRANSPNGAGFVQIGLPRSGYFYYTVQSGDTLSALADQFNTTMQAIREYNDLPDNDSVFAGREIRIPYGVPTLTLSKPPVPLSGTRFVVSISRQQCWVYRGERVLYSWDCSTGAGERRTKPGNYDVQSKILNAKSNIFELDMPYWLGIYDVGPYENGVHGLPVTWEYGRKIWSGLIGQPATFGCAMLDNLEAATLFRMAFLGMPVHVVN